jgi:tRNA 2-selenouridine synthase
MRASVCIRIELSFAERVKLLRNEYLHLEQDRALLCAQLDCLLPLHGHAKVDDWKALAAREAWDELVARLLSEHYDPAYLRSIGRNFAQIESATTLAPESAAREDYARLARALAAAN